MDDIQPTETPRAVGRRTVLAGTAALAGATALAPLDALAARSARADSADRRARRAFSPDYGPLAPVRDHTTGLPLLLLPRGFEYISHGWTGDPMSDDVATPPLHDGMAAFRVRGGRRHGRRDRVRLVRNHEVAGFAGRFTDPAYDPDAAGGTTTLTFDLDDETFVESHASLSGTVRNCAGGPTPWGSWLTCEETSDVNPVSGIQHGYVFEVPSGGKGDPRPLKAMGRFEHEAVAVDPATGYVYETEDAGAAGLFRFRPRRRGELSRGGVLEMLKIGDTTYDTSADAAGTVHRDTSWVTVDEPDPGPGAPRPTQQGIAKGGATFSRLEGAWYGNGLIYIVSTSGGPNRLGQVMEYDPRRGTLRVLFASPGEDVLSNPDNIGVSPRGGIVLCEDGSGVQFLHGLTTRGQIFPFAANNVVIPDGVPGKPAINPGDYSMREWAGSTFEPERGEWLFANIQSPGITFAITGPWRNGSL
ncbi:alkaline phosphatase PhoX [Nonomuraea sp. NPDC050643]|uniref:alkaline phosphatase PhoX n=1 Tax=Nonomuraea sp. NPDC050643 TaxID=3155660 RepID=UPI0033CA7387